MSRVWNNLQLALLRLVERALHLPEGELSGPLPPHPLDQAPAAKD
jgi:hypothetical protein